MKRTTFGYIYILVLFVLIGNRVQGQNNSFGIDSVLFAYLQKCEQTQRNRITLAYADTLYDLASKNKNNKMRAVALCQKMRYYHNINNDDSLKIVKDQIQTLSRQTNQPVYYYYAWQVFITHYIQYDKPNIALAEIKKFQNEAISENYKPGIATAYMILGSIYCNINQPEFALSNLKKHIEYVHDNNINDFSLINSYLLCGKCLRTLGRLDEALDYCEIGESIAKRENHKFGIIIEKNRIYLLKKQTDKVKASIDDISKIIDLNTLSTLERYDYLEIKAQYYTEIGDWKKALIVCDSMDVIGREPLYNKLKIYEKINNKDLLIDTYKKLVQFNDSAFKNLSQSNLAEFSTIMDIEQLNQQNNKLENDVKNKKIQIISITSILLALIVIVVITLYIRIYRLNLSLNKSKKVLIQKNNELIKAHQDLTKAFNEVEIANNLKTYFLKNISHEIRTPLNAVVGFSKILVSKFKQNETLLKFSDIIEISAVRLLKIITDIIELSEYDSSEPNKDITYKPRLDNININETCLDMFNQMAPLINKDVSAKLSLLPLERTIRVYKQGFELIITNLLHNAAEFTTSGSIELACNYLHDESLLIITVTDTGIGIPEDKRDKIFERYFKVNDFTHGLGIGLTLSRIFADRMHATIDLDINYTQGCRFIYTLPVMTDEHLFS